MRSAKVATPIPTHTTCTARATTRRDASLSDTSTRSIPGPRGLRRGALLFDHLLEEMVGDQPIGAAEGLDERGHVRRVLCQSTGFAMAWKWRYNRR